MNRVWRAGKGRSLVNENETYDRPFEEWTVYGYGEVGERRSRDHEMALLLKATELNFQVVIYTQTQLKPATSF